MRQPLLLLAFVWLLTEKLSAKPIHRVSGLPHSRDFYAGYIKAITDNFDQLFPNERDTRSTAEDDDDSGNVWEKEKSDKSTPSLSTSSESNIHNSSAAAHNDPESGLMADATQAQKKSTVAIVREQDKQLAISDQANLPDLQTPQNLPMDQSLKPARLSVELAKKSTVPSVPEDSLLSGSSNDPAPITSSNSSPQQNALLINSSNPEVSPIHQAHADQAINYAPVEASSVISQVALSSAGSVKKSGLPKDVQSQMDGRRSIGEVVPSETAAKNSSIPAASEENEEQSDGSAVSDEGSSASAGPQSEHASLVPLEAASVSSATQVSAPASESISSTSSHSEKRSENSDFIQENSLSSHDEESGSGDIIKGFTDRLKGNDSDEDNSSEESGDDASGVNDDAEAEVDSAVDGGSGNNSTGSSKDYDAESSDVVSNTNTTETARTGESEEAEPKEDDQSNEEKRGKGTKFRAPSDESNGRNSPEASVPKQGDTEEEESSAPDGSSNVNGKSNSTKEAAQPLEATENFHGSSNITYDAVRALSQPSEEGKTPVHPNTPGSFLSLNLASLNSNAEGQADIIRYSNKGLSLEESALATSASSTPSVPVGVGNDAVVVAEEAQLITEDAPSFDGTDYHVAPNKRSLKSSFPQYPMAPAVVPFKVDYDESPNYDNSIDSEQSDVDLGSTVETASAYAEERPIARSVLPLPYYHVASNPTYWGDFGSNENAIRPTVRSEMPLPDVETEDNPTDPKEVDISDNEVIVENRNGERRHYILEHANSGTPLFQNGIINYKAPTSLPYLFEPTTPGFVEERVPSSYGPHLSPGPYEPASRRSLLGVRMDFPVPGVTLPEEDLPPYSDRRGLRRHQRLHRENHQPVGLPIASGYQLGPQVPYPHMEALDYDRLIPILHGPYIHECGLHLHHYPIIHHAHHAIHIPAVNHVHPSMHHAHLAPHHVYSGHHTHPVNHRLHPAQTTVYRIVNLPHPCVPFYPFMGYPPIED